MKDAKQLLDLLPATGESTIEPTQAVAAARGPIYPAVCTFSVLNHIPTEGIDHV